MRTSRLLLPAAVLAAALAGCGGRDADDAAATTDASSPTAAPAPAPASAPSPAPAAPGGTAVVRMDVRPLAGQAEAGIQALLGPPAGCEDVAGGRRCRYGRGQSEITYIDGMADHIVIGDLGGAAFEPATIARIGLAGAEPLNVGPDAIEWQNVGGMRSVVLERGLDGRASRFVIKAMTP